MGGGGAYRVASRVSAVMVARIGPMKPFLGKSLPIHVPIRKPESAGRPHGGGGAYMATSLVSAVMLARIGPVKLFWIKPLITHSEGCGRAERSANALAQRGRPAWAARNPKARTQPCTCAARHAPHRR